MTFLNVMGALVLIVGFVGISTAIAAIVKYRPANRRGPVWPDSLWVNGIKYDHMCDVMRSVLPGKRKYVCPCGRVWHRQKGGYWSHNTKDPMSVHVQGAGDG